MVWAGEGRNVQGKSAAVKEGTQRERLLNTKVNRLIITCTTHHRLATDKLHRVHREVDKVQEVKRVQI